MIQIQQYREWLLELIQAVNRQAATPIAGVRMAVNEAHMIKKLKDKQGIWLCAGYPDANLKGDYDSSEEQNRLLLFLVEKVPGGQHDDEDEILHYAKMQRLMALLKEQLISTETECVSLHPDDNMRTEWEFDIFGGFNGLSLSLNMTDYDRADY